MVYHRRSLWYYLHAGLVRGIFLGKLRKRSLEEVFNDHADGAYARLFTRRELDSLLAGSFKQIKLSVMGQKDELLPIPRSRAKRSIEGAIPDRMASAILSRVGAFLVAEATRSGT
jgi:hypothetical protein